MQHPTIMRLTRTHAPVIAVLSLLVTAASAAQRSTTCPKVIPDPAAGAVEPFIVNGDEISPGLRPYIAALFVDGQNEGDKSVECSAFPIANRFLLTTAYCQPGAPESYIAFNTDDVHASTGPFVKVKQFIVHPLWKYGDDATYDIAVIELESNIPSEAKIMKVNVECNLPLRESFTRAAGYGVLTNNKTTPGLLRQVDVPFVSPDECEKLYTSNSDDFLCAGYVGKSACGTCDYDDGGPLIQYDPSGIPVAVAILSRSSVVCGDGKIPGVYVRVSNHIEWIEEKIGEKLRRSSQVESVFGNGSSVIAIGTKQCLQDPMISAVPGSKPATSPSSTPKQAASQSPKASAPATQASTGPTSPTTPTPPAQTSPGQASLTETSPTPASSGQARPRPASSTPPSLNPAQPNLSQEGSTGTSRGVVVGVLVGLLVFVPVALAAIVVIRRGRARGRGSAI